jgi:hypothetical protein
MIEQYGVKKKQKAEYFVILFYTIRWRRERAFVWYIVQIKNCQIP